MKVYSHSLQGKRKTQEDQHFSFLNLDNTTIEYNSLNLFGVFDGHGGSIVSKYLKMNLPDFFLIKTKKNIYKSKKNFIEYINEVYNFLQHNLITKHPKAVEYCGSTACVVLHYLDINNKHVLWLINVGDSRAVLCNRKNKAVALTNDHKPNDSFEKSRIESLGGKIHFDGYDWRIKSLSLSRAFGDLDCCPYVTHVPSIMKYNININDKFLIIACDGLWDALTNQDAVNFINNLQTNNFKGNYAKAIAEHGLIKGSQDNITVIIYFF
jgi:serine/threonine protein phosphatase PrpC